MEYSKASMGKPRAFQNIAPRLFLILGLFVAVLGGWGQNATQYPPLANEYVAVVGSTGQGARDLLEVIFFEIPSTITSDLYFAIRGPGKIGADPDEGTGGSTRFYIIGGTGAYSNANARLSTYGDPPTAATYLVGQPLKVFGVIDGGGNPGRDFLTLTDTDSGLTYSTPIDGTSVPLALAPNDNTTWTYFPAVNATQGELIGTRRYFRLVVVHSAIGGQQKNGFQADVSLASPGTSPILVPGARTFSYSWTINAQNATGATVWDLYPFVPSGSSGNVTFSNYEMDNSEGATYQNIDASKSGPVTVSGNDTLANTNVLIDAGEGIDTKGTWRYRFTETLGGGETDPNPFEAWASNGGEDLRLYTAAIPTASVPDPYRVVVTPSKTNATTGEAVSINLQIVDETGTPVDYRQDIFVVATDTIATTTPTITPNTSPVATDTELVTTDASGSFNLTLTDSDDGESVTFSVFTDGSNGSDNFGAGIDDTVVITFATNPLPTIQSLGDTTVVEGAADTTLQRISVFDSGTADLTSGNTLRIRLNTPEGVIFRTNAPTVTVRNSAGGGTTGTIGAVVRNVGDTKVFDFPITTTFGANDYLTIDALRVDATGVTITSDQVFQIDLDYNGDGTYDATDSRTITLRDSNPTYTYIGTDGVWATASNWTPTGPPVNGNTVIVSATASAAQPVVLPGTVTTLANVTIQGGGVLNLNGNNLAVSNVFSNEGTLRLQGSETVGFANDTNSGTIQFTGTANPATSALGPTYFGLSVDAGANTVTPTGNITVGGEFSVSSGSFDLNGQTVLVDGDWTVDPTATFNANNGTVQFTRTSGTQTIRSGGTDANHDFDTLIIATSGGAIAVLAEDVAVSTTGSLTVDLGAILNDGGSTISVGGNWTNNASGSGFVSTGTVSFVGPATTSIVSGNTTFRNLQVPTTATNKTIQFAAGSVTTIGNSGTLNIAGTSGNLVSLESGSPGSQWQLDVSQASVKTVDWATVSDSDLLGADPAGTIAPTNTTDSGGNDRNQAAGATGDDPNDDGAWWDFPVTAYTWDGGGGDGLWGTATNWSPDGIPGILDSITIPTAGGPFSVALDSARSINNVTIESGATLNLDGFALTITGTFSNDGTLELHGGETFSINGNAPPLAVDFDTNSGTVRYVGDGGAGADSWASPLVAGATYFNLVFNDATDGNDTWNGGATVNGALTVTSGSYASGATNLVVTGASTVNGALNLSGQGGGNSGIFGSGLSGSGTATYGAGTIGITGGVSVDTATGGTGAISVSGSVTSATSFTASSSTTTIGGSLTPGTFVANGGTVILNSTGPVDLGGFTFNGLTFAKTAVGDIVNSTGAATINGALTLTSGTWTPGAFTHQVAGAGAGVWNATAGAFALNEAGSTIRFTGANPTITTKGAGDPFASLQIDNSATFGAAITVTNATTVVGTLSANGLALDLGALTLGGGAIVDTTAAGTTATGAPITLASIVGATNSLSLNAGTTGTISVVGVIDNVSTLTIVHSGGATFSDAIGAVTPGVLVVTDTSVSQTVAFLGPVTFTTATFGPGTAAYNVSINTGAGSQTSSIDGDTTFLNTGSVTLGNNLTDVITFTGGLDTIAAAAGTSLGGVVETTNTQMDLGPVTLGADTTIRSGSAALNVASVTDGASSFTLTLGSAGQTGPIIISGNATVASLATLGGPGAYNVSLLGTTTTIDTATTFNNTGTLTLGGAGDTVIFAAGITATAPSSKTIGGSLSATNAAAGINLGTTPIVLGASSTVTTNIGAITFVAVDATTPGLETLSVNAGTASVALGAVGATTPLASLTVTTSGTTTLSGNISTDSGPINFAAATSVQLTGAGTIVLDTETGDNSAAGAVLFAAAGTVDAPGGAALSINTSATGAFNGGAVSLGILGLTNPLGGLTVNTTSGGATHGMLTLQGNIFTDSASGATVDFGAVPDVELVGAGPIVIDTELGNNDPAGSIIFATTGNLDSVAGTALSIQTGVTGATSAGSVSLGVIGATNPISGLTINTTSGTGTSATLTVNGAISTGIGGIALINAAITDIAESSTFTTLNGPITFGPSLTDSGAAARVLTLVAGTGAISLQAVIMNEAFGSGIVFNSGASLTIAGAIVQQASFDTAGVADGATITLGAASSITVNDAGADIITTGEQVNGAFALTLSAPDRVDLGVAVGNGTALASLTVSTITTARFGANVTTSGAQAVTASTIQTNSIHTTINNPVTFTGNLVLQGNTTINTDTALGDVTVTGTVDASAAGGQALSIAAGTGNINLQMAVGTTALSALTVSSATTARFGSNVNSTGAQAVTANTIQTNGTHLTVDNAITFNGALVLQAPTVLDTQATATNTADITIGAVTGAGFNLTLDTGHFAGADINGTSLSGVGTLTIQDAGTTTFTSSVGATVVAVTDAVTLIDLQGPVTAGTLTVTGTATAYVVSMTGDGSVITNPLTFGNTGLAILGDAAADVLTFTGGVTATAPSGVTLNGNIRTAGAVVTLGDAGTPVTLAGTTSSIDTTNAGGVTPGAGITVNGAVNGTVANTQSLALDAGTGGLISFGSTVGAGTIPSTLTVTNSGGASFAGAVSTGTSVVLTDTTAGANITFTGALVTPTLTTAAQDYDLDLLGSGTIVTNATTFLHTGLLVLGDAAADVLTFTGGVTATAPSGVTLNGNIRTAGAVVTLGDAGTPVTLAGTTSSIDTTNAGGVTPGAGITVNGAVNGTVANTQSLALDAGTGGLISFGSTVGAGTIPSTLTVTNSGGASFAGAVSTGTSVVLTDTTAGANITFTGALVTPTLTTAAQDYDLDLLGSGTIVTNATTFLHTGLLVLGDAAADVLTFTGGVTATAPSGVTLSGTIRSTNTGITLGDADTGLTLTATTTISTDTGLGNILFGGTVDGPYDLVIDAGTGTVTFSAAVGGTTPLGDAVGTALSVSGSGGIVIAGVPIRTAANQIYNHPVTLSSATVIVQTMANSGSVTFVATVSGIQNLSVITHLNGTVSFDGDVSVGATAVTALSVNSASLDLASTVDLNTFEVLNGNINLTVDGLTLAGTNTINAGTGIVTITPRTVGLSIEYGDLDTILSTDVYYSSAWAGFTAGSFTLGSATHEGNITLTGVAAAASPLTVQNVIGGTISVIANYVGDDIANNRSLLLDSGTGGIALGAAGGVNISLGIGTFTASDPTTITGVAGVGISASGGVAFTSNLTALVGGANDLTITAGTGNVTFTGVVTINDNDLTVASSNFTTVTGGIGGTTGVIDFTTATRTDLDGAIALTGAGAISLDAATISGVNITTVGGGINFSGAVLLDTGAVSIGSGSGAGNILFSSTVAGAQPFTVESGTGTLQFLGLVGSMPLSSLTITNSSTLAFDSGLNITGALTQTNAATGLTTFTGAVSVGSATLRGTDFAVNNSFTSSGAIDITNSGTVTKNATGTISTTTATTGTFSTTGNVTTAANITTNASNIGIGGNLVLSQGTNLTLSTGVGVGGNIVVSGTTNGTTGAGVEALTTQAGTGLVTFSGAVGNGTADELTTVTVTNSGALSFGSTLNITGALTQTNAATGLTTFTGAVSVGSATLRGTDFAVNNSFTSSGAIDITNSGTVTKNATGTISTTTATTGTFSTTGNVTTAANITTNASNIGIGGNLVLSQGTNLTLSTGVGAGNLTVTGTTNGTAGGADETFALEAGTGNLTLTGQVGDLVSVGTLTVSSATTARFVHNVTTVGAQQVTAGTIQTNAVHTTTNSNISLTGNLVLQNDTTLTTGTGVGNIAITGTSNGTGAGLQSLTLAAGTGNIDFGNVVGGGVSLAALTVSSTFDITLRGIGTGGAGVTGAMSVTASNQIDLAGTSRYHTGGTQTYDAADNATIGTLIRVTGNSLLQAGGAGFTFRNLYIDSNGQTLTVASNIQTRNLIVYRGILDLGTHDVAVSTDRLGGGDFVVFGSVYNPDDADRAVSSGVNNALFQYPGAATLTYYPGGGTYNGLLGDFSVAPNASFANLDGSTITVGTGTTGNFYVNGADLPATALWNLAVRDNVNAQPSVSPPFGLPYAVFFNGNVNNSNVTAGRIIAPSSANGQVHHNVLADGAAVIPNALGAFSLPFVVPAIPNTSNTDLDLDNPTIGWDFVAPYLAYAQTMSDNIIRLTFSEPIENSNNQISAVVASLFADGGTDAFATSWIEDDDAFPYNYTTTDGEGDLTTFYIQLPDTGVPGTRISWATDATGSSTTVSTLGTDRYGNSLATNRLIPNLSWIKGVFVDATSKTPIRNYGRNNSATPFNTTTDEARPVLYQIRYGRAPYGGTTPPAIDAHNFFELRYSEPVDIGGLSTTNTNTLAQATFADNTEFGGHIAHDPAGPIVAGYFQYDTATYPTLGPMITGDRRNTGLSNPPVNSLYTQYFTNLGTGASSTNGNRLQIFLAGFYDVGQSSFPGWYYGVPDPADTNVLTVLQNDEIVDAQLNPLDHTLSTTIIADSFTPADDVTGGGVIAGASLNWDVDPPVFVEYGVSGSYEIVSRSTDVSGLTTNIDFFILDNSADAASWDSVANVVIHSGYPPVQPPPLGVRDSLFGYPLDGGAIPIPNSFVISVRGGGSATTQYTRNFTTAIQNELFEPTLPNIKNVANDPYFGISIDFASYSFGPLTQLEMYYDYTESYITDLAGNLLYRVPPGGSANETDPLFVIERQPPSITLAMAATGGDRIYLLFSEPAYGDANGDTPPDQTTFSLDWVGPPNIVGVEYIRTEDQGKVADGIWEMYLLLDRELTANELVSGTISANTDSLYDNSINATPDNSLYSRPISDVATGSVTPVYATDGYETSDPNSRVGQPFQPLRVFNKSGTLRDLDITLQARIEAGDFAGATLNLLYDLEIPNSLRSPSDFWSTVQVPSFVPQINLGARLSAPTGASGSVRTFRIPAADPELVDGNDLEFIFELANRPVGWVSNPNEPLGVQTWGFSIGGVITQRAGVTIVNNVINPIEGDTTALVYSLDAPGLVTISVFTLDGNLVKVLQRGPQAAGSYTRTWDGTNTERRIVTRGVYMMRIVGPGIDEFRRVLVVRP